MLEYSTELNEIAAALSKAQGEMEGAKKDAANPFFKSKYADLASVWDACREPLAKNSLAVTQGVSAEGNRVTVTTMLMHSSGQWVKSTLTAHAADDKPQSIGSCTTYNRRYGLSAIVGIAPEDDDGNAASGTTEPKKQQKRPEQAKHELPAKPPESPACKEYEELSAFLRSCGCKTPEDATAVVNWAVPEVGDIRKLRPMAGECSQILAALKGCGVEPAQILQKATVV